MRMTTSMKMVNCNNLFCHYIHSNKGGVLTITDKLKLANGESLYYSFIFIVYRGPARFYHRLANMLYNVLDEGGYFDEDD
jgi:hypothetical protein|uniref:Uncharacterized protein n=1 Tax=Bacteriophage sp. TaxID=38018 RepID=A0A7G9A478_9VIRU|nr:MAG: hypothetical protein [Bacteriophage sp.]